MCAIEAGKRGRKVAVIEHAERIGKKILISGGGRCNFTNTGATAANYLTSGSPHFCKSALARYTPADFLALVERHGIAWHEKKLGQLFCDSSSRQIVEMLENECASAGVSIRLNCRVNAVSKPLGFEVDTNLGTFTADSLVIASGGLSFAKLGATDFGYRIAGQFGLKIVQPRPGLVPLTFNAADSASFSDLSGLSVDVAASSEGIHFRENLLITHRGLSGPAILQASSYSTEALHLDILPDDPGTTLFELDRRTSKELKTVLSRRLPQRFAQAWCSRFFATAKPMCQMSNRELELIAARLHDWEFRPAGTEGYPKAEVTVGGVDTSELSSKSMESRKVPGLYFIGEVVDLTGWLGGFNFQWAWSSGHAAGQVV